MIVIIIKATTNLVIDIIIITIILVITISIVHTIIIITILKIADSFQTGDSGLFEIFCNV